MALFIVFHVASNRFSSMSVMGWKSLLYMFFRAFFSTSSSNENKVSTCLSSIL
ncbi:hypothetical protein [Sanguibacteroides justesenii]|uniref:hypothetical protein n=1 Tax=Sanguibacteroides justesenii TaxID=1547597 RepID=UPI001F32A3CC|nr:hypothetical protein [Sanguibacteroides justesenii]